MNTPTPAREGLPEMPSPIHSVEVFTDAGEQKTYQADADYYTAAHMLAFREEGIAAYIASQPKQSGLNDELEHFKIQVEKRLCAILGKEWSASGGGVCLHNLYEEIETRVASQPTQGGIENALAALDWIAEHVDAPNRAAHGSRRGIAAIKYRAEQTARYVRSLALPHPQPDLTEQQKADRDAILYGTGYMLDGKHIPLDRVIVVDATAIDITLPPLSDAAQGEPNTEPHEYEDMFPPSQPVRVDEK